MASESTSRAGAIDTAEAEMLFAPLTAFAHSLAAVSGGTDSTVMMVLLSQWQQTHPACRITVATVDHGLRAESANEAAQVGRWAADLGLSHTTLVWAGPHPKTGLQHAARDARYRLLVEHAKAISAAALITAHHANDQAETILMRLASGSGLSGLAGMKPLGETCGLPHLRPLLSLPKARLSATLERLDHPHFEDPSNSNPRFARARWREAEAILQREGFDPVRMERFSRRMARADAALEQQAQRAFETFGRAQNEKVHIFPALFSEPEEVVLRVLAKAIGLVSPYAALRLERLENLVTALSSAHQAKQMLGKSLGGAIIRLAEDGKITVKTENDTRRKISNVDEDETPL